MRNPVFWKRRVFVCAIAIVGALAAACAEDDSTSNPDPTTGPTEAACGIVVCAVDERTDDYDVSALVVDPEGGKADASDEVGAAFRNAILDGELSVEDIRVMWDEAGDRKSVGERAIIRDAIAPETDEYTVTEEAIAEAKVLARTANITNDDEVSLLAAGRSFSGTEIPEAVHDVVANARLNGAVAYDVQELDDDGEGKWTPYPSVSQAVGNMAFDYTEVTPRALEADKADANVEYNAIVGSETATTSWGREYTRARYERRQGGTGNVSAHYDEVYHEDLYARGVHGQKWASNVAILSDGSFHFLPAARRDVDQRLILTNPALARGQHLLYNGHITILNGQVTSVEMSGRISKMAAKGKTRFIDPIPLLEAWGFEMSPDLRLRFGNTSDGVPVTHDGVIMAEEDLPQTP